MPTPIEVTTNTIQDLLDKKLIRLIDPATKEDVTIDHELAQRLINDMAQPIYDCVKELNTHRDLNTPDATLPRLDLVLTAPCPSLDIPWTEEKIREFSAVLDEYETE